MNNILLNYIYCLFYVLIPSYINCKRAGLTFKKTWKIVGKPVIIKRQWYERLFKKHNGGMLKIGDSFTCNNIIDSNSLGIIQPCVFNIAIDNSLIKIGNNVGISGSTINAATTITIEDNVIIGSGCLITDTDSHPLTYEYRLVNDMSKTNASPIIIKEGAFIGARSIIMKGVTIGKHVVIGAGSVVTKSIPDNVIACGNPAKVVKSLVP